MLDENDSRLALARIEGPPAGTTFRRKRYHAYSPEWRHDHCVGCHRTIAEYDRPEYLNEGFASSAEWENGEDYYWACVDCFEALQEQMGWTRLD